MQMHIAFKETQTIWMHVKINGIYESEMNIIKELNNLQFWKLNQKFTRYAISPIPSYILYRIII